MLVFYSVLVFWQLSAAMFYLWWYFIRSQYVGTNSTATFYVCQYVFFWSLSTAIFYGVCWYFIPPQSRQYPQYGHVLCMVVFYSALVMLVRPVWPCSVFSVLFGLSTLVRLVQPCSTFVAILFRLIITLISQLWIWSRVLDVAKKSARNPALINKRTLCPFWFLIVN